MEPQAQGKQVPIHLCQPSKLSANVRCPVCGQGFLIADITIVHAGGTNKVAQGAVTEPVFLEKFLHEVDLAAAK